MPHRARTAMSAATRVLYAEDSALDADLTRCHFQQVAPGITLEVVNTGAACLNRLAARAHDVLLLNHRLPDMPGLDVLTRLQAVGGPLPVVLISGQGEEASAVALLRLGASDYLVKRDNYLVQLPHVIAHVLRRHRLEQGSRQLSAEMAALKMAQTQLKAGQNTLARRSRLCALLSQCNRAIVHCSTQEALFDQVCRDAVRVGGMKMAWIGRRDCSDERLKLAASFGEGSPDDLAAINFAFDRADRDRGGPAGLALRTGHAAWCQDIMHPPDSAPWQPRARQYGWATCAALPLFHAGATVGVLTLYAGEVQAFDERSRGLLVELSKDISLVMSRFEREAARLRVEDALRLTRISVEATSEAMFWITPDADIVDVNEAACRSLGYARPELLALNMMAVNASGDIRVWRAHFNEVRTRGSLTFESSHRTKTGRQFPVEVVATFVKSGEDERVCSFVRDISEHKAREARIQQLAQFDALTGLPNRVMFLDRLSHALSMAQRSQASLAILLLDLNHFKRVNDTLGHHIGDLLLTELAHRLSLEVRDEDTVSRLGGDEFLLLLPGNDATAAAHVAEKLLYLLSQPYQLEQHELVVMASIGIAMHPGDGDDFESLSQCADVAMYRAKQEGRNGFRFCTAEMQASSARTLQLENALRHALKREQLSLHYQPQLSLSTGRIIGVEALLRWQHPELGSVSPAEFIPVAESSGQIIAIGAWVLGQALGQLQRWMRAGLRPITMAVNLSVVQFRHPQLPALVTQLLQETGVAPHLLELEVPEGVATDNVVAAMAIMHDLHARGVSLVLDDFGTGHASLAYLKRFKLHKLKIDRTFVHVIERDPDGRTIVLAIVNLANSLGIQTSAEGVESLAQLDFLRLNGCGQIQGYQLSDPLPAAAVRRFIDRYVAN